MDIPNDQHAAQENMLFDAEGNPREQERVMLSETIRRWPHIIHQSTQHEWADEAAALEQRVEGLESWAKDAPHKYRTCTTASGKPLKCLCGKDKALAAEEA